MKLIFLCYAPILFNLYDDLKNKRDLNFERYVFKIILALVFFLFAQDRGWAAETDSYDFCEKGRATVQIPDRAHKKGFTPAEFEKIAAKREHYLNLADYYKYEAAICMTWDDDILDKIGKVAFTSFCLAQCSSGPALIYSLLAAYGYDWYGNIQQTALNLSNAHYYYSVVEWIDDCRRYNKILPLPGEDGSDFVGLPHAWRYHEYDGTPNTFSEAYFYDEILTVYCSEDSPKTAYNFLRSCINYRDGWVPPYK